VNVHFGSEKRRKSPGVTLQEKKERKALALVEHERSVGQVLEGGGRRIPCRCSGKKGKGGRSEPDMGAEVILRRRGKKKTPHPLPEEEKSSWTAYTSESVRRPL